MSNDIAVILTPQAPAPGGHYSQAVTYNGVVYVAGQLPVDPHGTRLTDQPVEVQAEQTLRNVKAILEAAGSGLDRVLQMTIYITDIGEWGAVNAVYSRMMGEHRPARAIVPVGALHYGLKIEIQAIAAQKQER